MKVVFWLLVAANVALFAWSRGWLDGLIGVRSQPVTEPERLARQVRPETIRIVRAPAGAVASAASSAAPTGASAAADTAAVCIEAGPYTPAEIGAAEAAVSAALPSGSWVDVRIDTPGWLVYMGRYATRGELTRRSNELRRRGIAFEQAVGAELEPGLTLGRYGSRQAAEQALPSFVQQGARDPRVVEATAPTTTHLLRIERADPALAAQALALRADALGKGFAACVR